MKKSITSIFVLVIFSVLFPTKVFSQVNEEELSTKRASNVLYLNIAGEGSVISFNYEKLFGFGPYAYFAARLGMGYAGNGVGAAEDAEPVNYFTLPHHLSYNAGKGKHFLEVGLTGTYISGDVEKTYLIAPLLGYRLQPLESNNFCLRIFASAPFTEYDGEIFYLPLGISVGYCF